MHAWLVQGNDSAKADHMNLDTLTLIRLGLGLGDLFE
jgi:hypothetical protein